MTLAAMWFFGLLVGLGLGYLFGEREGTRDTERRWTEAVARADDARAMQRPALNKDNLDAAISHVIATSERRAQLRHSRLSDGPFAPQPPVYRPARYLRAAVVCFLLALGVVFAIVNYWSGSL